MSKITVVIEYDTDTETALVRTGNKVREWHDAKISFTQGITETRDAYLIRHERDGTVSMLLTGMLT